MADFQRLVHGLGAKRQGSSWKACCPCHDDKNGSLDLAEKDGKILLKCFAGCDQKAVISALRAKGLWEAESNGGLPAGIYRKMGKFSYVDHWTYRDTDGRAIGHVVRYQTEAGEKEIRPYFKQEAGTWKQGAAPKPRPLYGLWKLEKRPEAPVIVCEGEKACDAAQGLFPDQACLTSPGGSNAAKAADWKPLAGRSVLVWPDNDEAGMKYASDVVECLHAVGADVRGVIDPEALEIKQKGDAADWPAGKAIPEPLPLVREAREAESEKGSNWKPPATITAAQLKTMEFPEPTWIVPGVLPEGTTLVVGRPKLGKSFLLLEILLATQCGGYALGRKDLIVPKIPSLYISLEDTQRRLQSRIQSLADTWTGNLHLVTSWRRLDNGGIEDLTRWLDIHRDVKFIGIDTWAKIKGKAVKGAPPYEEDVRLFEPIKKLSDERGLSIGIVHHSNKSKADDILDEVSGTTGLTGSADTILILRRGKNGKPTLYVRGRDVEENDYALQRELNGGWTLLGKAEDELTEEQQVVVDVIQSKGAPITQKEIRTATGQSISSLSHMMSKLLQRGVVESPLPGVYILSRESFISHSTNSSCSSRSTCSTTFNLSQRDEEELNRLNEVEFGGVQHQNGSSQQSTGRLNGLNGFYKKRAKCVNCLRWNGTCQSGHSPDGISLPRDCSDFIGQRKEQ